MKKLLVMVVALSVMVLGGCNMLIEDDFNAYLDDRNDLIDKETKLFEQAQADFSKLIEDPNAKEQVQKTIDKYEALVKEAEGIRSDKIDDLKTSQDHFVKAIQSNAEGMKLSLSAFEKQDAELDKKSQTMFEEAQKAGKKSESELEKFAEDNDFTLEETKSKE
ncbi:hypothetical protein ABE65_006085 [Fictibacillus phosphorivorans]|uniref:Lipoprotein n=1 Tax=Fictibacillus phosphorivorans TaxID=1221500 RepID=A0A168VVG3_9BACL|nr:hypothetical protein [Fictibacillus phosphorivorans]ANC76395.1 hypothetical protein ABE65_006085 [Fictibacillus phosphorivorans]